MEGDLKAKEGMSVLLQIYAWSIGRPAWQCDALRRIITKDVLDDLDKFELEHLCRQSTGITRTDGSPLAAVPLGPEHLPAGPESQTSVSLEFIENLNGVNRLPAGQKVPFGSIPGLTVIYGDNGTGKSGYVRVIKKACRSRGAPPVIHPDAFAATTPKPSCKIGIIANGTSDTVTWEDEKTSDDRLGNVFVFDSTTAWHYIRSDGPASFTPFGLDVLPKLTKICDSVGAQIKADIKKLNEEIQDAKNTLGKYADTKLGIALAGINHKSSPSAISALGGLSEAEAKRLADLRSILGANPKQKATETRASKARVQAFKTLVDGLGQVLSAANLKDLKSRFENAEATEKAAKDATEKGFSQSVLVGTGSKLWQAMWAAAREFSVKSAYPDQKFPHTKADGKCVLCQRAFADDPAAAELAESFERFCNDDIQKAAQVSKEQLKLKTDELGEKKPLKPEHEKIAADLNGLGELETKLLQQYVTAADDCLATVKNSIKAGKWHEPELPPARPSTVLENLIEGLETRAKTEESADDPTAREKLQKEQNELLAKEWFDSIKEEASRQIDRHKKVKDLESRLEDTRTNSITTQSTAFTKTLITEAFCNRFADEVKELGVRTLKVQMQETRGTKGENRFGVRLEGVKSKVGLDDILSEGEQRCVALGSFLAELSQASHQSALVFDDPVSSLDHYYRGKIAARLAKEAKHRQVIVFTHDTVFLNDLSSEAEQAGTPFTPLYLRWDSQQPGHVESGLPWDCKSPEDRLDKIEKKQKTLEKSWSPQPDEDQKLEMRNAYSLLRATIERIVERVIFADVVFRFRSYVNLKNLGDVVGFPDSENQEVQRLFKKCCEVTEAHDTPDGKQAALPEPADLLQDIQDAKKLLETVRTRRKNAKKTT